jgi:hypothetical protein
MKKIISLAVIVFAVAFAIPFLTNAGAGKVNVCHITGSEKNPVVEISVSVNALKAHLDHGDFLPDASGNCVQSVPTPTPTPTPSIQPF